MRNSRSPSPPIRSWTVRRRRDLRPGRRGEAGPAHLRNSRRAGRAAGGRFGVRRQFAEKHRSGAGVRDRRDPLRARASISPASWRPAALTRRHAAQSPQLAGDFDHAPWRLKPADCAARSTAPPTASSSISTLRPQVSQLSITPRWAWSKCAQGANTLRLSMRCRKPCSMRKSSARYTVGGAIGLPSRLRQRLDDGVGAERGGMFGEDRHHAGARRRQLQAATAQACRTCSAQPGSKVSEARSCRPLT